jgi:predicted GTPase
MQMLSQSGAAVVELEPVSVLVLEVLVLEVLVLEVLASGSRCGDTQVLASVSSAIAE